MGYRILGKDTQGVNVVNSARRQQGLLQIFKDFCESDDVACEECVLLRTINETTIMKPWKQEKNNKANR